MVRHPASLLRVFAGVVALAPLRLFAADNPDALAGLAEQNRRLQQQVEAQQRTIEALNARLAELAQTTERHEHELRDLANRAEAAPSAPSPDREHEVRVMGEAGAAFFHTGSDGQFPKSEFRADDPMISIEAPVAKDVYFFTELKLLTRETNVENFQLGEMYVDFENLSAAWGHPGLLSFRAGRVNIPFGEEYQFRYPVENPLISHSLSDLWGTDEGVEIYGRLGPARYVVAVQNGGTSRLHDFNADKAVVGRIGWDPYEWLHLSGSAMRTGELSTAGDQLSDLWFANGFIRALGPANRATKFWADLFEGDARVQWKQGHASAAFGGVRFDDSDPVVNDSRRMRYGYLEVVQAIADRLYGAARYSQIRVPRGYPLAGWGAPGEYFFAPALTTDLRRLSAGIGYHVADPVVVKFEYAWESGRQTNGEPRDHEDFFGSEIAVKF